MPEIHHSRTQLHIATFLAVQEDEEVLFRPSRVPVFGHQGCMLLYATEFACCLAAEPARLKAALLLSGNLSPGTAPDGASSKVSWELTQC